VSGEQAVDPAHAVGAVGVVVPARDEEQLLPGCLAALCVSADRATEEAGVTVDLLVVLDRCVDGSGRLIAGHPGVRSLVVDVGNVGLARAAGFHDVLGHSPAMRRDLWLATTDADSRVPPNWLVEQVGMAEMGADLVLGTVDVDDWSPHPACVEQRWRTAYDQGDGHPHVHGANVGLRAEVYQEIGGFPGLASDEDVAMVAMLAHHRVLRTGAIPVLTSARRTGRLSGGFADHVAALAGAVSPPLHLPLNPGATTPAGSPDWS